MRRRNRALLVVLALGLLVVAAACNYPGMAVPTSFTFPTPDLTLTAVFQPTETSPSTPTGGVIDPNVTPTPTGTIATVAVPTGAVSTATSPAATSPTLPTATATVPVVAITPIVQPPTATPTVRVVVPTVVPTFQSEGPSARPGPSVSAPYLRSSPVIDGVFDDWPDLERVAAERVVAGSGNWSGVEDLSSRVMFGWDEGFLYLAARVRDDRYVQDATGINLFKGDSLEILMDTNVSADFYVRSLSQDDFQLGISPGEQPGTNPESYLWYPQGIDGSVNARIAATPTDDGYRVEAAIPWSIFGVSPRSGQHFGFAYSVSDNDSTAENVQQSMVSNVPTRNLADPTTWGDLTLSGTAVGPQGRPGGAVEAVPLSAPPVLDGNLAEWTSGSYPVNQVVYGREQWDSAADLSGNVRLGWDSANLYLGVQVVDNRYVQNATGEDIFLGDSLELLIDTNLLGDFADPNLSSDDIQLGISPGRNSPGGRPEAYLWFPRNQAGERSQVAIGAAPSGDGYIVEVAVPWNILGISPSAGQRYGFAFSISDNDNFDRDVQQSMVSNVATRALTDPTDWGELVLR